MTKETGANLITPENDHEFTPLPNGAYFQLFVPMICPDCADIHNIPIAATALPRDGLAGLVRMFQERLIQQGFRVPSQEDFAAALERMEAAEKEQAEAEEAMEQAEELAKKRGLFYIHRTPDPRGDA
jgi:hypothetical protein